MLTALVASSARMGLDPAAASTTWATVLRNDNSWPESGLPAARNTSNRERMPCVPARLTLAARARSLNDCSSFPRSSTSRIRVGSVGASSTSSRPFRNSTILDTSEYATLSPCDAAFRACMAPRMRAAVS